MIGLPWVVRNAVTRSLATATVITGKFAFNCMPNAVQKKYDDYCLAKAEEYTDKVLKIKPIAGLLNTVVQSSLGSSVGVGLQAVAKIGDNEMVKTGLAIAGWFCPQVIEAVVDPQKAALRNTVMPLIRSAHELLAREALDFTYGVGFDVAVGYATGNTEFMTNLALTHTHLLKAIRASQVALLAYVYGPTLYKAGALGLSLFDAHAEATRLKDILFSPGQQSYASDLAAKAKIQGITGDAILQAAAFLLLNK